MMTKDKTTKVRKRIPASQRARYGAALRGANARGHGHKGNGPEPHYSIKAVAESFDVSERTVRRWIARRLLVATRIGGVVRIADGDLRAFHDSYRDF